MKKTHRKKNTILVALIGVFSVLLLVSAYMIVSYFYHSKKEQQAFEALANVTFEASSQVDTDKGDTAALLGYRALQEQNPSFFGWIRIENTNINYPVMHTPDAPEYYLHRAFDGSHSRSGVPFLDAKCFKGCGNYLIYGHNMRDDSMFSALLSYAEEDYRLQHPHIYFDTPDELGVYEVVAAFYSQAYEQEDEGVFRFYSYKNLSNAAVFNEYVALVNHASLYDSAVDAKYGEALLTLSTCSSHIDDGRFVVVAKKIN